MNVGFSVGVPVGVEVCVTVALRVGLIVGVWVSGVTTITGVLVGKIIVGVEVRWVLEEWRV